MQDAWPTIGPREVAIKRRTARVVICRTDWMEQVWRVRNTSVASSQRAKGGGAVPTSAKYRSGRL
jgi:hypothetical protein